MTYQPERKIEVGEFFIAPGIGEDRVWVGRKDGEGGDFPIADIEALLAAYYVEHF